MSYRIFLQGSLALLFVFQSIGFFQDQSAFAQKIPQQSAILKQLKTSKYVKLLSELQEKHGFSKEDLKKIFEQVQFRPEIIRKFEQPAELLPYVQYKSQFLKPDLIAKGRDFLQVHHSTFERIQNEYGVEKEVVAATLGIESKFGDRAIQKYRVFDVLNTAFALYPKRRNFFRQELIEYLLLCREQNREVFSIQGSYAGAFGAPQFMPSSFRKYAVDDNHDGKIDLWDSPGDIIASVANYLKLHRWEQGGPLRLQAQVDHQGPKIRRLLNKGFGAQVTLRDLMKWGVHWEEDGTTLTAQDMERQVSLVSYLEEGGKEKQILIVFQNFKSLADYNPAIDYVLVVLDFSDLLKTPPVPTVMRLERSAAPDSLQRPPSDSPKPSAGVPVTHHIATDRNKAGSSLY
jgi:membrane-bound lytic murein transglycosylase B